ncbi:phosphoglycerate mutase family protein [Oscillospiraceae bacterium MB08-C2-2]|nr:phosphoglycerate mutase family protein [Oscillospiraceae bacterium MB08-C2-2]
MRIAHQAEMSRIHLIRHGKTRANLEHLYCGRTDLPLCSQGIEELEKLSRAGPYPGADCFFTSGALRTEQTLALTYGVVKSEAILALMEYHFGEFEMKSYEQLKDLSSWQSWALDTNGEVAPPGGESRRAFAARIQAGFEQVVCRLDGQNGAVICHGGVIANLMEAFFPGEKNFYQWQPACGRGYTLVLQKGRPVEYMAL